MSPQPVAPKDPAPVDEEEPGAPVVSAKARAKRKAKVHRTRRRALLEGRFGDQKVGPGESALLEWKISESPTHQSIMVPLHILRGHAPGPVVLVTSAIHGDEINGVAIVRRLLQALDGKLAAGTLVAVPVVNRFGFDRQDRYLPDRRDLNRHFPGEPGGHMADRIAHHIFTRLVLEADVGIDLHTAAEGATNLCHIRGDADDLKVRPLMRAFGTPIMMHGEGPRGSLRRAATEAGVPTVLFEAGEPGRFQPHVVDVGLHGILRVLRHLGMAPGPVQRTNLQILVRDSHWVRSDHGGILDLRVAPGDLVREGALLANIHDPVGRSLDDIEAPRAGVVLGVSTMPLVFPGKAIAHVGHLKKTFAAAERFVQGGGDLGHVGQANA